MEEVLGFIPEQYGINAKGDDCVVAAPEFYSKTLLREAFNSVYYQSSYIKGEYANLITNYGCGMVLKFLSISDYLDDIDFCSTNCFYCEDCKTFRLTRKIDRFITLTPWSDSIFNLNDDQQSAYLHNLYLSNLKWCEGLSIFTPLNNTLRTNNYTSYNKAGKPRKQLPLNIRDAYWYSKMFNHHNIQLTYKLIQQFGKAQAYGLINQVSGIKKCCKISHNEWLKHKLSLDDNDIIKIESDINNHANGVYHSPTLTIALINFEEYKNSLNIST
jgi:hypothetical protein